MSDDNEVVLLSDSSSESESNSSNSSNSSSSSSCSSSESEIEIPTRKPKRVTKKDLGEIQRSDSPPPKARRKYAPRGPLTEEAKEKRRQNLVKARTARSAYAAQRRVEALKHQLTKYDIKEESSSDDEEIVLTKKHKQKLLPTKKEEKLMKEASEPPIVAKKKKAPREHKEKIDVDGPKTIEKKKRAKQQDERLKLLESMMLDQAKRKKEDRSKTTIINIGKDKDEENKSASVNDVRKILLDLGI